MTINNSLGNVYTEQPNQSQTCDSLQ